MKNVDIVRVQPGTLLLLSLCGYEKQRLTQGLDIFQTTGAAGGYECGM